MTGTADLSFEQVHTIHRSTVETSLMIKRVLIHPAADKAVNVYFDCGMASFAFRVLRDGKRVPPTAMTADAAARDIEAARDEYDNAR